MFASFPSSFAQLSDTRKKETKNEATATKETQPELEGSWSCPQCTFINSEGIQCAMCGYTVRDVEQEFEDKEMNASANPEPIPLTLGECKKHQTYAVEKFLGKYEIVFPNTEESVVGTIISKGKAHRVFRRENVHTLHSRDRWIREMRQVKPGEKPVKIIKKRKRRRSSKSKSIPESSSSNKLAENDKSLENLELFGHWQTIEWKRQEVKEDGKIPRGKYGHVEVWTESHIPKGCAHVDRPRIASIAKKLGIEYAKAMTGFEVKSGRSLPVISGIVVLEDHKDLILTAWKQMEAERKRKLEEAKVRKNLRLWRSLIRKTIIHQKVMSGENVFEYRQLQKANQKSKKKNEKAVVNRFNLGAEESKHSAKKRRKVSEEDFIDEESTKKLARTFVSKGRHKHEFRREDEIYDESTGLWSKTCFTCGKIIKWREL
mmetsp:Transcript_10014/g.15011  ORF Transcript_10014/g.15011 Transcript_10014/m.15011 type:complete len:431 (+) Transcript_10014:170-1462(+)